MLLIQPVVEQSLEQPGDDRPLSGTTLGSSATPVHFEPLR